MILSYEKRHILLYIYQIEYIYLSKFQKYQKAYFFLKIFIINLIYHVWASTIIKFFSIKFIFNLNFIILYF
jgi:hypothetical protein